ncbi:MAG TPA: hypothetical protein VFG84_12110, partial [Gemmatimonadaceae bacterium]|nr:hypothetical protein [Gemmatimonadaceae bacterium]
MRRSTLPFSLALCAYALRAAAFAGPLDAQERAPSNGGLTPSLGQPGLWQWAAGAAMGAAWRDGEQQLTSELSGSVSRFLGNPLIGLGALQFEVFAGTRNGDIDGGLRARLAIPFARVSVGADHNLADGRTRLLLSLVHPGRRSGLFTDGSVLRLDVSPSSEPSVALGIEKPFHRRIPPGTTRPVRDHVVLSAARVDRARPRHDVAADEALAEAREVAAWIGQLTVPWLDHPFADRRRSETVVLARIEELRVALADVTVTPDRAGDTAVTATTRAPRAFDAEVRRFHTAVERAFLHGLRLTVPEVDTAMAQAIARRARTVILDDVLLPYDRLLGQDREDDTTREFAR